MMKKIKRGKGRVVEKRWIGDHLQELKIYYLILSVEKEIGVRKLHYFDFFTLDIFVFVFAGFPGQR